MREIYPTFALQSIPLGVSDLAAQDEAAVAPSQSLVSLTRAVRASASSAPQVWKTVA